MKRESKEVSSERGQRLRRVIHRAALLVAVLFVFSIVFSAPAQASHYKYAPFGSAFTGNAHDAWGLARYIYYGGPTADQTNGEFHSSTMADAFGAGAAWVQTWGGFRSTYFTVSSTGWKTIKYQWQVWGSATTVTTPCSWWGINYAEGYLKLLGNVRDADNGGWMRNGNAELVLFHDYFACGLSWGRTWSGNTFTLQFDVYLFSGTTYEWYTYAETYAAVGSVLFAYPNAWNDYFDAERLDLRYMYHDF